MNLARTTSVPSLHKTLGDWTLTDTLPTEAAVYEDIKFLWLDPATLHDPAYPDSFWRHVFFAGTRVVGADADVQELAQRLGLEPNQRVLQGGLWTVSHLSDEFLESIRSNQNGNSFFTATDAPNPFKKHVILGKKRTHELRVFSIWFLVSFTLFELAIIIGSIYLLHGGRRVFRWLLIPISAILYTILGLFVVRLVVDFRPEVQIFREIDSVEGWPESSVSTQVTRLAFNNDRTSFSTPASAAFRWSAIESETAPLVSAPNADGTTFSMRQHYGRFSTLQIGYAQPAESPCTVSADGHLTVTRPLHGGWLWDGKVWREFGPIEPGQPITIARAKVVVDPGVLAGMGTHPARFQSEGSLPEAVRAMVDPAYLTSLKDTRVGLLLAIDDRAIPEQMEDAASSEIHTQTLLVHQFQLPAPVVTTPP